jgi:hypothetical protein
MTKIVRILVLVAILTATLAVGPAQVCACGGTPDWSKMSDEAIVSTVNATRDGQRGGLPPAPAGYRYDATS